MRSSGPRRCSRSGPAIRNGGTSERVASAGPTLNTAAELPAYTLTDRGTWISFASRGDLEIVFEGDPALHNPYGVILVNPEKPPARQGRGGTGLHRLAGLARGPGCDRRLQDRRRAALLPERGGGLNRLQSGPCFVCQGLGEAAGEEAQPFSSLF